MLTANKYVDMTAVNQLIRLLNLIQPKQKEKKKVLKLVIGYLGGTLSAVKRNLDISGGQAIYFSASSLQLLYQFQINFCLNVRQQSDVSCFQGLFFCPEACSLLLHNFCIYHISPPGHEVRYSITRLHNAFALLGSVFLVSYNSHRLLCHAFFKSYFSWELK